MNNFDYKKAFEWILKHGAYIKLPYKEELDDWYREIGCPTLGIINGKYTVRSIRNMYGKNFDSLKEALEEFIPNCDNIGAIQCYTENELGINSEENWDEMVEAIKKEKEKRDANKSRNDDC